MFLERGEEREKEGEKHQCVVASRVPPTGDLDATQARALIRNQTSDPLVHRPGLNPLSHTSQSQSVLLNPFKNGLSVTLSAEISRFHSRGTEN